MKFIKLNLKLLFNTMSKPVHPLSQYLLIIKLGLFHQNQNLSHQKKNIKKNIIGTNKLIYIYLGIFSRNFALNIFLIFEY
jgi:hypothetical protein